MKSCRKKVKWFSIEEIGICCLKLFEVLLLFYCFVSFGGWFG